MTPQLERTLVELAQGLRRAHCSRGSDELHECVGKTTITRDGVDLECKLCGDQREPIAPSELLPETKRARRLMDAIGLDWDALVPERKRLVVEILAERSR